ncbi:hypothetical protein FACS189474_0950 [Bacteroidia bacterium]|nr:hypothetical protein FACS189474_0950 [Bacteroidia bacterium]
MKKYIFGGIAVLTVVAAAALNINFNTQKSDLSGISLANVEALAQSEGGIICHLDYPYTAYCNVEHKENMCPCGW